MWEVTNYKTLWYKSRVLIWEQSDFLLICWILWFRSSYNLYQDVPRQFWLIITCLRDDTYHTLGCQRTFTFRITSKSYDQLQIKERILLDWADFLLILQWFYQVAGRAEIFWNREEYFFKYNFCKQQACIDFILALLHANDVKSDFFAIYLLHRIRL